MNVIPKPHQLEALEYCKQHHYVILAMEMGTGKSLAAQLVQDYFNAPTLIIVPSYLKYNWRREYRKFFPDKNVCIMKKRREIHYPIDADIVILPYSFLKDADCLFEWAKIVVFDEVHFLCNAESLRSQEAHRLVFEWCPKKLLLLTGTPIQNKVMEFYSLISLCSYDPRGKSGIDVTKQFPTVYDFADFFSYKTQFTLIDPKNHFKDRTIIKWKGLKNEMHLKNILKGKYFRKTLDECVKLPPYLFKDIFVEELDLPDLLAEFEDFQSAEGNNSVRSEVKKEAALTMAPITSEYVKDLWETDCGPIIIFSDHVDSCRYISDALEIPYVDGTVSMEKRQLLQEAFQRGELKGISATIDTFSTGYDLTASNNLVLNDPSWVPGRNDQAFARLRRIGQTKTSIIHRMLGSYQAEKIMEALEEKRAVIKRAT